MSRHLFSHAPIRTRQAWLLTGLAAALAGVLLALPAGGAGGPRVEPGGASGSSQRLPKAYDRGVKLVEEEDYDHARRSFERALHEKSGHPDILNMLAFTQRKTGHIDLAIETYKKALERRPRFPQAREYLGEAYLAAAMRELETLAGYGKEGAEEHGELLRAVHTVARKLPPPPDLKSADAGW